MSQDSDPLTGSPHHAEPVIDVHVHALPASLVAAIAGREVSGFSASAVDGGWQVTIPGAAAPRMLRAPMIAAERRAQWADQQGLTRQVVSPWLDAQPPAALREAPARDWAFRLNETLTEQEQPRGNPVLATVAVTQHAPRDLRRAVEADGMAGLILSTSPPGAADLADPALEELWETAAGLGVPVMLHPPSDGPARSLSDSAEFGNTFCRLVDTTFAVTKLLLSGVLDRHPALRLVVVHGGGFLPYQSMRLDGGHRADALSGYRIKRARPSDYLSDLYFDTVALRPESVRFLAGAVGAGRVLLGSDYPFPLGDRAPVATVRSAGLGRDATAAVLGANAAELFSVPMRSGHA